MNPEKEFVKFLKDSEFTDQRELEKHVKSSKPGPDELEFDREQPFTSTLIMEEIDKDLDRINTNLRPAADLHLMRGQFGINVRRPADPPIPEKRKREIEEIADRTKKTGRTEKKGGRKLKRRQIKKTKKYRNKK